jgi:hypothetical protein
VLAAAVSADADYLVTGDRQLQRLGTYEGVRIVSPRDFLALLDADAAQEEQGRDQTADVQDEEQQHGEEDKRRDEGETDGEA